MFWSSQALFWLYCLILLKYEAHIQIDRENMEIGDKIHNKPPDDDRRGK